MTVLTTGTKAPMRTFSLPPFVNGDAVFNNDFTCRFRLDRFVAHTIHNDFALWVGYNPSLAGSDLDDPTIRVEWNLTQRWWPGFILTKVNMFPFVSSHPRESNARLIDITTTTATQELMTRNEFLIDGLMRMAKVVIVACGAPEGTRAGAYVRSRLISMRRQQDLMCVGVTIKGWPVHPLHKVCILAPYTAEL